MTPHFTLHAFTASDTAKARGIVNDLPSDLVPAAVATLMMMERIREALSKQAGRDVPILPSSGYRCPALNWAVRYPKRGPGSDATGDHPKAAAMDWRAPAFGTPVEVCTFLAPLVGVLQIGQLIYEGTWVHTSTRLPMLAGNRIITKVAGGYVPGIVEA